MTTRILRASEMPVAGRNSDARAESVQACRRDAIISPGRSAGGIWTKRNSLRQGSTVRNTTNTRIRHYPQLHGEFVPAMGVCRLLDELRKARLFGGSVSFSPAWDAAYREGQHLSTWPWSDVVSYVSVTPDRDGGYSRVLECGCGAGANIPFFERLGMDYFAIEGSDNMVAKSRRLSPS